MSKEIWSAGGELAILADDEIHEYDLLWVQMIPISHFNKKIRLHAEAVISYTFKVPIKEVTKIFDKRRCLDICCYDTDVVDVLRELKKVRNKSMWKTEWE